MEKAARLKQLVDSRTVLLDAVAGLEEGDFETVFGAKRSSLKTRLAQIAATDWEMAKVIRDVAQGRGKPDINWFSETDFSQREVECLERRCCCSATEVVSEAVLSLQALLDELRRLADEHFHTVAAADLSSPVSAAFLVDVLVRHAEQHCEDIRSWRGQYL